MTDVSVADVVVRELIEMVEAIFHIEDLYELARKNSFIAVNFFQLMTNLDYVILTPIKKIRPVGSGTILGENVATEFNVDQDGLLKAKLGAVAECFRLQAAKMDSMINSEVLGNFMQGTGAAQIAQDAVNALLSGGMMVAKEGVKALPVAAVG